VFTKPVVVCIHSQVQVESSGIIKKLLELVMLLLNILLFAISFRSLLPAACDERAKESAQAIL
jgi:hypothetical protein